MYAKAYVISGIGCGLADGPVVILLLTVFNILFLYFRKMGLVEGYLLAAIAIISTILVKYYKRELVFHLKKLTFWLLFALLMFLLFTLMFRMLK